MIRTAIITASLALLTMTSTSFAQYYSYGYRPSYGYSSYNSYQPSYGYGYSRYGYSGYGYGYRR
jgi:hypothetical protein